MSVPIIPPLSRLFRRNASAPAKQSAQDDSDEVQLGRQTSRQLCAALDRATQLGLWEHAERIAQNANRVARLNAGLTDRIARLRLVQGDSAAALAAIDACPARSGSLRLLRNVCLIHAGRRSEAHMDLHAWSARASCPLTARVLLAMIEWKAGSDTAAIEALVRNLKQIEDPDTVALLTALCVASNRPEQASDWAKRLAQDCAQTEHAAGADVMLRSLELPGISATDEPGDLHVHTLAAQLLAREGCIAALVTAQQIQPDRATARLLAAAIEQCLSDLETPAIGYESLARLALVLDDREAALDWIRRGIELCPMSSGLVRLSRELCSVLREVEEVGRAA